MPILRVKEIRDMSAEDRSKRLGELRTELLRLRTMIRAGGTIENPARIKEIRKAIAKMLTIEHEERLGIRGAKKETKKKAKEKPKPERKKEK
jgi:large subunit ribosomal protein L29